MTYTKVGEISKAARDELLAYLMRLGEWTRHCPTGDEPAMRYWAQTGYPLQDVQHDELLALLPADRWAGSFAVMLLPGDTVHPHTHWADRKQAKYNVVLQTNSDCWCSNGGEIHQLDVGVYRMERRLEHWAANMGRTPRVHLILTIRE